MRRRPKNLSSPIAFEPLEPRLLLSAQLWEAVPLSFDPEPGSGLLSIEYLLPELELEELTAETAAQAISRAQMGAAPRHGGVGQPVLPVVPAQLIIPSGYRFEGVEVVAGEKVTLEGSYFIEHAQEPLTFDGPLDEDYAETEPDLSIYESDNPFPYNLYDVVGVQRSRGVDILTVNLNPVEYIPSLGRISYYTSMALSVTLTEAEPEAPTDGHYIRYRPDPIRPLDGGDPGDPGGSGDPPGGPPLLGGCDPNDSYQYVVITNQAMVDATTDYTVLDFLAHKQALGFSATVVTVEDIYAEYSGVDQPEQVRNFIIDAYNHWETDYILLGGDSNILPQRSLWVSAGAYSTHIPSDLYYQCLDGSYNYDGDNYWGEVTDGMGGGEVDLMAEVYIGRVSAATEAEMANWIYKTVAHENDGASAHRSQALMVGEYLGFGGVADYAKDSMEEIRLGSSAHGYGTAGFAADPNFAVDTLYQRDQSWSKYDLIDLMNSDTYGVFNHLGHANTSYVMKMYNSDADALTNENFFFIYSQGCYPGNFPSNAIAEHFTTSSRHGAYAVVMNSRYGWGAYYSTNGPSQRPNRQFWDAVFGEEISELGAANADSHEDNIWGIGSPYTRWVIYETNLFGDPALDVADLGLSITSPAELPPALTDTPYEFALSAKSGTTPYTWAVIDGSLPTGLTLEPSTGILSGTAMTLGTSTFTVQVTDAALGTDVQYFQLSVVDEYQYAPEAASDIYDAFADTPFHVDANDGVLANDTDENGDPLTAHLAAGPSHGTVLLNEDGSLDYTPYAGFTGDDSFTYWAFDGADHSDPATVTITVTTDPDLVQIVVDNQDAGFSGAGTWQESGVADEWEDSSSYCWTTSGGTATWTPVLPGAGTYDVYAWWANHNEVSNRDSDAEYTVTYAGGASQDTIAVDQDDNGGQWNLLGTYAFDASGTENVTLLSDNSDPEGRPTSADAIRWVRVTEDAPVDIVVDNRDTAHVRLRGRARWSLSSSSDSHYGNDYLHDQAAGKGKKSIRFTPELPSAGEYDVYIWYPHSDVYYDDAVPVDVIHSGGIDTITIDESTPGGDWAYLGNYTFDAGAGGGVLVYTEGTDQYVVADATRWVKTGNAEDAIVVDDGDPTGVTFAGDWTLSWWANSRYGATYYYNNRPGEAGSSVAFTPAIESAGTYEVSVWYPDSDVWYDTDVPIDVVHAGGTDTVVVDQSTPCGGWEVLGTFDFDAGTDGRVVIRTDGTTQYVVADAVKFRRVSGLWAGDTLSGSQPTHAWAIADPAALRAQGRAVLRRSGAQGLRADRPTYVAPEPSSCKSDVGFAAGAVRLGSRFVSRLGSDLAAEQTPAGAWGLVDAGSTAEEAAEVLVGAGAITPIIPVLG